MECQCEHEMHELPCSGQAAVVWDTIYGVFLVCNTCGLTHRPPTNFFK